MTRREKNRRMLYLMGKHRMFRMHLTLMRDSLMKVKIFEIFDNHKNNNYPDYNNKVTEMVEVYNLGEELGLSDEEIEQLWVKQTIVRLKTSGQYNKRPIRERKDNKRVLNTSGGNNTNRNTVRYPSKKRSRATWKRFYILFPRLAERDGWDGKKSKKM